MKIINPKLIPIDRVQILPCVICVHIFSFLNPQTLFLVLLVSKRFCKLGNEKVLWRPFINCSVSLPSYQSPSGFFLNNKRNRQLEFFFLNLREAKQTKSEKIQEISNKLTNTTLTTDQREALNYMLKNHIYFNIIYSALVKNGKDLDQISSIEEVNKYLLNSLI